jgi:hypothetical protein
MNSLKTKVAAFTAATVALSVATLTTAKPSKAFIIKTPGVTNVTSISVGGPSGPITQATDNINFTGQTNNILGTIPLSTTFNATNGNGNATLTNDGGIVSYSNNNFGGTTNTPSLSVSSFLGLFPGQASFNFAKDLGYFGLYWGAPGSNLNSTIQFLLNGTSVGSFTASSLGLTNTTSGQYVQFFVSNNNEIFNQVRLIAPVGGSVFRADNISYAAIPTPALLPGLIGVMFGVLRKRKAEVEGEVEGKA